MKIQKASTAQWSLVQWLEISEERLSSEPSKWLHSCLQLCPQRKWFVVTQQPEPTVSDIHNCGRKTAGNSKWMGPKLNFSQLKWQPVRGYRWLTVEPTHYRVTEATRACNLGVLAQASLIAFGLKWPLQELQSLASFSALDVSACINCIHFEAEDVSRLKLKWKGNHLWMCVHICSV